MTFEPRTLMSTKWRICRRKASKSSSKEAKESGSPVSRPIVLPVLGSTPFPRVISKTLGRLK